MKSGLVPVNQRPFRRLLIVTVTTLLLLSALLAALRQNSVRAAASDPFIFLPVAPKAPPGPCHYVEENARIVMEVESAPAVAEWVAETAVFGFTGDSYYTWRGPDYFGQPGIAVLNYPISVTMPGAYNLRFHNYNPQSQTRPDLSNDVFVRMDDGFWVKAFSSGNNGSWNWETAFDFGNHNLQNAAFTVDTGLHTLSVAARSRDFSIDRIVLYIESETDARNTSLPVSACLVPNP